MAQACVILILEHLAHFPGQYSLLCFYGLFEWERLASLSLYTLRLVLIMRVSPIDWISQQYDQFGIRYDRRSSSGDVRMKQIVRASLSRDVFAAVTRLERKIGTVPIVTFSEIEIEIVYFLSEGRLHMRVLHQELIKKSSTTLLRTDDEKVGQRPYRSCSQSPKAPGSVSLLDPSLHNSRFLAQARTYYKPKEGSSPEVILLVYSLKSYDQLLAEASAANRERRVTAVGMSFSQLAIRPTLTAVAVASSWRWVFFRPR